MFDNNETFYDYSTSELVSPLQEFTQVKQVCFAHDVKQVEKFPASICLTKGEEKVCYYPHTVLNTCVTIIPWLIASYGLVCMVQMAINAQKMHIATVRLSERVDQLYYNRFYSV